MKKTNKQLKKLLKNAPSKKETSKEKLSSKEELQQLLKAGNIDLEVDNTPTEEKDFNNYLPILKDQFGKNLMQRPVQWDESILKNYDQDDQKLLTIAKETGYGYFHEEDNEEKSVMLTTPFGMPYNLYAQPTLLAFFKKWFLKDETVYEYVKNNLDEDFPIYLKQYPSEVLQYVLEYEMIQKFKENLKKAGLIA